MSHDHDNRLLERRSILKGAAAAAGLAALLEPLPQVSAAAPPQRGLIRDENSKPGTADWRLRNAWIDPGTKYRSPRIEGYCSTGSTCQVDNPLVTGSGSCRMLREFPLAFWMEKEAYDVSYIRYVDTQADGAGLTRAKGFLSVGHDLGARNVYPWSGRADWICSAEKHWLFAGTGMKNGDRIPRLVGWECG